MKAFFDLFVKHADVMDRVTVWGVSDGDSWKNDFPVKGRKEYPLLFDRNHQTKPFLAGKQKKVTYKDVRGTPCGYLHVTDFLEVLAAQCPRCTFCLLR